MKRCPTCNRTYTKDDQKFCPQDGTRLEEIEEVEFDPLQTIVATPKPSATDDAPPARESTPPPMPSPPREEEEPVELDPLRTMVATPASSSSSFAEPPAPPVEEERAALEEKADEPPPAREESFDPFQTILGTPPPRMSEPTEPTPPAPSMSSSAFDGERTVDRAPSESLLSEATPASAFAEPLTSQYAPPESAPYQTPEPTQAASDWGANQQPVEYGQQYGATPVAPSAPQEKKRKGAALISVILGVLSLLLVAVCGITGLTKGMAFGIVYPMLRISAGTFPMMIIVRYLMIVVLFGLPFIGLIFGIYALIKSWKQPVRYGGKGLALTGVLTSVLADVIFFASLSYTAWRLMAELQQLM
ncbi:MAG: hypothetical protein WBP93_02095 [Pyrinomonadaceae bacterium]